jgi:hypothetical protein
MGWRLQPLLLRRRRSVGAGWTWDSRLRGDTVVPQDCRDDPIPIIVGKNCTRSRKSFPIRALICDVVARPRRELPGFSSVIPRRADSAMRGPRIARG